MRLYDVTIESLRRTFHEFGVIGDPKTGADIWLREYENADLFPEVEEVLHTLAAKYPMVIISNVDDDDSGYAMLKKKQLPLRAIITSESSRSYKPHAKMFRKALSILECRPEKVLHVGDSQIADVLGAKKAGMLAAWLNRRSDKLRPCVPIPDYEITDLRELVAL
jgi:2-haloalkanoic acid dehalogenase type II